MRSIGVLIECSRCGERLRVVYTLNLVCGLEIVVRPCDVCQGDIECPGGEQIQLALRWQRTFGG